MTSESNMQCIFRWHNMAGVFLVWFVFPRVILSAGDVSFHPGVEYISPRNISFLEDISNDTCTTFEADLFSRSPQYTTLRVQVLDEQVDYLKVSLLGENLTCGSNLYVCPLTAPQTRDWAGMWLTCDLKETSNINNLEWCLFDCQCIGGCSEIQVCKRPRKLEESSWTLCHFQIEYPSREPTRVNGCDDFRVTRRGIYRLKTPLVAYTKDLYCDVKADGTKWTVLLRRKDGSENFARGWNDYKSGFGSLTGEFWAGNELMHKLTTDGRTYSLRVELESFDGEYVFAEYRRFSVGPESDNYRLHVTGYSSNSTAGNSLQLHNNMMFTTRGHDNDEDNSNCAVVFGAPWWFKGCHSVFLTGRYGENLPYASGITWSSSWGTYKFARYAVMMIRPNV